MPAGFNGTKKIIDIAAGQTVSILATGPVRRFTVIESNLTSAGSANTTQGINYYLPNDGSTAGLTTAFNLPAGQLLQVPDESDAAFHGCHGEIIGNGPGVLIGVGVTPATTLCKITSATANGTSVIIEQFY